MKKVIYLLAILLFSSCGENQPEEKKTERTLEQLEVMASHAFLNDMFQFMAGDEVKGNLMTRTDPHHWSPDVEDLAKMQEADLILLNGAGYEMWTNRVSIPYSATEVTGDPFKSDWIFKNEEVSHSHGNGEQHVHASTNPYFWLSPVLAIKQTYAIYDRLVELFPERKEELETRFEQARDSLTAIDHRWRKVLDRAGEVLFVCDDEELDYFFRQYQIRPYASDEVAMMEIESARVIHLVTHPGHDSSVTTYFDTGEDENGEDYFKRMNRNIDRVSQALN